MNHRQGFTAERFQRVPFTLIELLVVISIIAILAGMLLPALSQSKDIVRRITCANNLKTLTLTSSVYAQDMADSFPAFISYKGAPSSISNAWIGKLAEYYKLDIWKPFTDKTPFACAARKAPPSEYWKQHFMINPTAAPSKSNTKASYAPHWTSDAVVTKSRIKKQSRTFLFAETRSGFTNDAANPFMGGWHDLPTTGMVHSNKANWGMVDGHVEFMHYTAAQKFLAHLATNSQQMWE